MSERIETFGTGGEPVRRLVIDPVEIENRALGDFLRYWRELRGSARLPSYGDFSPKRVKAHLGWTVIADALPDYSDFRFRLVGSHVTRYFLADGTGKTIGESFEQPELAQSIIDLYRLACVEGVPVRLTGSASVVDNILFPDYDTMYLPFSTAGGSADKVINVFTFDVSGCAAARQVDPAELPKSLRAPVVTYKAT